MNDRDSGRELVPWQSTLPVLSDAPDASVPYTPGQPVRPGRRLPGRLQRSLLYHPVLIALCSAGGLLLALLPGVCTQPVYRSRTLIEFDSAVWSFPAQSGAPRTTPSATDFGLQTQSLELQSESLLQQVAELVRLQPHEDSVLRDDLLSRAQRALGRRGGTIPYETLLDQTVQHVHAKPVAATRVMEVTCDSWDPRVAAQVCNTLTSLFARRGLDTRVARTGKTRLWLTAEIDAVRQRTEQLRRQLREAVGADGMTLSQMPETIGESRLKALQAELVRAQADRMQREAVVQVALSAKPDALPEVQSNPEYRGYQEKIADLRVQLAQLFLTTTDQNPTAARLRVQIVDAETALHTIAASIMERQTSEYLAALHREELLNTAYKQQETLVSSELQKKDQIGLLRKEVDAEQQLYETLTQQAREADLASVLQETPVFVLDPALPARTPISPRRWLDGGFGLALGALLGFALALYRERTIQPVALPANVVLHLRSEARTDAAVAQLREPDGSDVLQ